MPTDQQRRPGRAMASYGMPQMDIGTFLDIDAKTLRKHFTRELKLGSIDATTKVAQSLFRMATEGKHVAAAIFWMKTRAGWREKQPEALEDKPPEEMTDAELEGTICGARDDGSLPKSHVMIEIVRPAYGTGNGPVIDGQDNDFGPRGDCHHICSTPTNGR